MYMVFDVESIGLHGEGFAVAYVIINKEGLTLAEEYIACSHTRASGTIQDRRWVEQHIVPNLYTANCETPYEVREKFWNKWRIYKDRGIILCADVPWPVEARFLAQCIDDHGIFHRNNFGNNGPYPLLDIASIRFGVGLDPINTGDRLDTEIPLHNPLADARQSARLLLGAIEMGNRFHNLNTTDSLSR